MLYFLTWRDIKVRYKQTALGAVWAILQPLLTMAIFSLVFGRLAKMPSDGVPYPIFAYAALIPWGFFATGVTSASMSLVGSANLLRKVYFPRLAIPIATLGAALVDFGLAFLMLLVLMPIYKVVPSINIVWLPLFALLAMITALGVGLWFSAINVQYRDVRYVIPFLMQIWMLATPVAYPSSIISEPWRALLALNPMTGVVEGFRWALLGAAPFPGVQLLISGSVAMVLLVSGAFYFRRMERTFADVV